MTRTSIHDPAAGRTGERVPRKIRTRARLLAAAEELYGVHGVDDASVEAIAALAGTSIGSVYAHFGSKDGLALAVAHEAMSELEARLAYARDRDHALDRVRAAGDAYFQFSVTRPALSRYLTTRAMSLRPGTADARASTRAIDRRIRAALLATATDLKQAMDEGLLRRMPVDALMMSLWGLCSGIVDMVSRRDALMVDPVLAQRSLELGTALILSGERFDAYSAGAAGAGSPGSPG